MILSRRHTNDAKTIRNLERMLEQTAEIKEQHGVPFVVRP
jgi:hypothetical protein